MSDRNLTEADAELDHDRAHLAQHRARLVAEDELAEDELAEIEDHLRELAADLREHGARAPRRSRSRVSDSVTRAM